ncbi:hypothetical protein QWY82_17040 [Simiduia curdlanivorans]|uniref:DUF1579 domain-containing protein n=1 Tax=Simiduia curdlanivorans TaxID=1492769 RepID=A0ABV8UYV8_9GAMM|nr:hypothetical protein [Simiduia curdlanivorans]MDN3640505.1 hypothetical protein [Simiduia curdlanivorans]
MNKLLLATALVCNALNTQAAPCEGEAFRQFDFWLGHWNVYTPNGTLAGTNNITRSYGGCVVQEHYETVKGYTGESLNIYDAGRERWHQTWVDNQGTLLLLEGGMVEGGMVEGSMILAGQTQSANGVITQHRISWTANADGSVHQHWQSTDKEGQWQTAFMGRYTRQ